MKKKTGCLLLLLVGFAVLIFAAVISIRGDLRHFDSNREAVLADLNIHLENKDWDYVVTTGEKYTLSEDKELIDLINLAKAGKKLAERDSLLSALDSKTITLPERERIYARLVKLYPENEEYVKQLAAVRQEQSETRRKQAQIRAEERKASASQPPASTSKPRQVKDWYSGGTLHSAKMSEWSRAPYDNRLATSGDFVTKLLHSNGKTIPPIDQLKPLAQELETAISTANKDGIANNQDVATVAATCWVLMNQ